VSHSPHFPLGSLRTAPSSFTEFPFPLIVSFFSGTAGPDEHTTASPPSPRGVFFAGFPSLLLSFPFFPPFVHGRCLRSLPLHVSRSCEIALAVRCTYFVVFYFFLRRVLGAMGLPEERPPLPMRESLIFVPPFSVPRSFSPIFLSGFQYRQLQSSNQALGSFPRSFVRSEFSPYAHGASLFSPDT